MKVYGKELVLDLHKCEVSKFNRTDIKKYLVELCDMIGMEREDLHWWDYQGVPPEEITDEEHLVGTSAIQFIKTSNVTIHTLDLLGNVFFNIFSCKDFDSDIVVKFTEEFFKGETISYRIVDRHKKSKVEIKQQKGHNFLWIDDYLCMWDIPVERSCMKEMAAKAFGEVLCAGYGLGVLQRFLAGNSKVDTILTIERESDVIKECQHVYEVIHGDIKIADFFTWETNKKFDCVLGDIWEDMIPVCLNKYAVFKTKAKKLVRPGGKILAWGQDYFEYLLAKERL